eukprot:TRINITY_DN21071_c0_g1_i1.p1 TRINITY_DN21071_c0_g1~~TRINITY_DN21071_c0_g1_i1.p1  ORF type:complete len:350 (-),score=75.99 TRINITY_DN21071_c0_g1_i1:60-1052(-)
MYSRLCQFRSDWGVEHICGKIVLAKEGINGAVSGHASAVKELQRLLTLDFGFTNIIFKDFPCGASYHTHQSHEDHGGYDESKLQESGVGEEFDHKRFIIKFKPEIITLKCDVDMKDTAPHMKPETLKEILDSGSDDVVLMDIRNEYEYDMGHFEKSLIVPTRIFSEFSDDGFLENLKKQVQGKTIVTYCTGGVRCEKATALMRKHGFENVWQLEGGILNYGLKVGPEHWTGKCLVFDRRKAVEISPELELKSLIQSSCNICKLRIFEHERQTALCKACQKELSSLCPRCCERLKGFCSKGCLTSTPSNQSENKMEGSEYSPASPRATTKP